jgi:acyl-CoA hydrolase
MTELVLPSHTNALGTIFGGVVMGWIDVAGAIAAQRFCRTPVVTVSIDYLHFIVPIKIGYTVRITAQVTYAGTTSIETEVLVDAENAITGDVRRATNAFLTYVSIDEFGRPKKVPALPAKTAAEKKLLQAAEKRRQRRLEWIKSGPTKK